MSVQVIPLSNLEIRPGRRSVSRPAVRELSASIRELGLLCPISVYPVGEAFELVAGRHRVEAVKSLGWSEITAVVLDLDDVKRELAEIDENLVRSNLTAADQARQTARRKELYLKLHPETARGGLPGAPGGGKSKTAESASFASDTAAKTGASERTVRQDVQIGKSITADVFEAIEGTPLADSKTDLLALARLSEDEQREVVAEANLSDKASIRGALSQRSRAANRRAVERRLAEPFVEPADESQDYADDAPDYADQSQETYGAAPNAEHWCAACGSQYRGAACACVSTDQPWAAEGAVASAPTDVGRSSPASMSPAPGVSIAKRPAAVTTRTFSAPTLDAGDLARALLDMRTEQIVEALTENATAAQKLALASAFGSASPTVSAAPAAAGEYSLKAIKAHISARWTVTDILALERELPLLRKEIGARERAAQKAAV